MNLGEAIDGGGRWQGEGGERVFGLRQIFTAGDISDSTFQKFAMR